jgi:hypothetical protein
MRPGQLQPNELETAILERIAKDEPWLQMLAGGLHVLKREFTGVGSYTHFLCDLPESADDRYAGLNALIRVPSVPNGMQAVLWCRSKHPDFLEIVTFGNDHWDGTYDGFYLDENTGA